MTVVFKLDTEGGFTAGDTKTGLTSYAYPTSPHAEAARKNPEKVAVEMVKAEFDIAFMHSFYPEYDAQNWKRIKA